MGIFDAIIGGSSSSSSSGSTTSTQTGKTTTEQTQKQTMNQTQDSSATGSSNTQLLDTETIGLIKNLIGGMAGSGGVGGASQGTQVGIDRLMQTLNSMEGRANNSMADLQSTIDAQQNEARRQFGLTTGAQINQMQQQVGSRLGNSFSQLLEKQGNVELNSSLAKIASDAFLQGKALQSSDLATVAQMLSQVPALQMSAEQSGSDNIVNLLNVLKGATQTQQTQDQSTSTLTQVLDALLKSQTDSETKTNTNTSSKTKSGSGLLGALF